MPKLLAALVGAAAALVGAALALVGAALALPSTALAQGPPVVSAYPSPGTQYNLPGTQITFRGIPASQIGQVTVVGSQTGQHTGQIEPDSDNDGGSFVPTTPFARGEKVTVTTSLNIPGSTSGTFSFLIARTAGPIQPMPLPVASAGSDGLQHFNSRPDLQPGAVTIAQDSAPSSQGDIFLTPQYGPSQNGPMILDPKGHLIWFLPTPISQNTLATDFRVQTMGGQPVLTWWQGYTNHGSGRGVGIIFDRTYKEIATVQAGNGLMMDLHEFLLTPSGQAWVIAVSPDYLSGVGKPVMDSIVQEVDVPTGLVLFEWHALDHVPTTDSYFTPKQSGFVFDPYHLNSVSPQGSSVLISMRDTSAIYDVDESTGRVLWTLGGKHSTFKLGPGVSTAFQHDALEQSDGSFTIFDDGAGPPMLHQFARGIRVRIDPRHKTATLEQEYDHSPDISSNFEGNVQQLSSGDVFLGWGQQPYFSEDDASGRQILDGRFVSATSSYRAYRFPWSAQPPTTPAIAVAPAPGGATNVYASWNGATDVSAWRVLAGPSATALAPIATGPDTNFETTIPAQTGVGYFEAQALAASGQVLASSTVSQVAPHLALYGHSAFVSGGGTGAIPTGCLEPTPCKISTTVSVGRTVIARTGAEYVAAAAGSLLFFSLSPSGRTLLAHAARQRVAATVSARDTAGYTVTSSIELVRFSTQGAGPHRTASNAPPLSLIGSTDFVNRSAGVGGILVGCAATTPCFVSATLKAGSTTVATTGREFVGPQELGYVVFSLSSAGRSLLTRAAGNQLAVNATLSNGTATATGTLALVGF